jgi:hypothetical protein
VADVVRDHGDLVLVADGPAAFVALATGATAGIDAGRAAAERHFWPNVVGSLIETYRERIGVPVHAPLLSR